MNEQSLEILKESIENNQMNVVVRIPQNMKGKDRNSLGGLHRSETPLHIFPMTPSFDICHVIPHKYLGIENDTRYLFGASRDINNAMREPERKLDEMLEKYNVVYDVEIKVINSNLEANIQIEAYDELEERQDGYMYYIESCNCDNHFYLYQLQPLMKSDIRDRISHQNNSTPSNKKFNEQWNAYKKKEVMLDGSVVEGVQITSDTFIDISFNQYFHKGKSTIVDQIDGINWIYGQYISYIVGLNKDLIVYAENLEDVIKLTVIKDSSNKTQALHTNISKNLKVFDLSDVIQESNYELTLYRRSHSKLYEHAWELESGEVAELDEETMTVYPAQYEDGSKAGISFKDKTSTLITGGVGSGKTSAIKTMIMPFIKSDYADVAILDMKESNDWAFAKDYVQTFINDDSGKKGHILLHELKKEVDVRNKNLPEGYGNFWEIPLEERPFKTKFIIIDEFHKLMNYKDDEIRFIGYKPSDIYAYIVKVCRNVGINFICLTQQSTYRDTGRSAFRLFNNTITLRGDYYNHVRNETSNNTHLLMKSIRNDDKGRGVGVIHNDSPRLVKFGYYSSDNLLDTIKDFKKQSILEKINYVLTDNALDLKNEHVETLEGMYTKENDLYEINEYQQPRDTIGTKKTRKTTDNKNEFVENNNRKIIDTHKRNKNKKKLIDKWKDQFESN